MSKSLCMILESTRAADVAARMAAQRAARLAAGPPPRVKRQRAKAETRWLDDVRNVIKRIGRSTFTLSEVYQYLDELEDLHPESRVDSQAAVRHVMQKLRDAGEVMFDAPGCYSVPLNKS